MTGGADAAAIARLERAAQELQLIARQLAQNTGGIQRYGQKLAPLAGEVAALVGGSATGKDKAIARNLAAAAKQVERSAATNARAAQMATRLAQKAHADAHELRRAAERSRAEQHGRR